MTDDDTTHLLRGLRSDIVAGLQRQRDALDAFEQGLAHHIAHLERAVIQRPMRRW